MSSCNHKNTAIWEPHLAGARKCLECGRVKYSSSSQFWEVETWQGFANIYENSPPTLYSSEKGAVIFANIATRIAVPVTLTWRKEK